MADRYVPPVFTASDTVDMQAGFFSRAGDAITKGIPSAAISGAMSIYNTFLDYGGAEAEDTASVIRGFDEDMGNYYEQNRQVIDLAGFVGTSIIPGALGIKALKLARSGEALGAVGRALNFAATPAQQNLTKAISAMGRSGGTITAEVTAAKRARLGWEAADQVLQGAAAEMAILATLNDSPIFENDTAADFAKNAAIGALFGGAIGGAFSMLETRGILKAAGRTIEGEKRLFDTVFDPANTKLKKADEILVFAENMLKLPDDFYNTNFTYTLGGKSFSQVLDTSEAFKTARGQAEKLATEKIKIKFNELTGDNENTGQALFEFIAGQIKKGKDAGQDANQITDTIQGYLQGVKKVSHLTPDADSIQPPKQFFISKKPTGFGDLFSEVFHPEKTGKQAFYLTTTDPRQFKFGSVANMGFDDAREAFDAGYDAVITKQGKVAINPKSKVVVRTPDAALKNDFYLDLETGSLTNDVILTGGDLLKTKGDFKSFGDSVYIQGKRFAQAASHNADLETPSLDASVRFMWAGSDAVKDSSFKNRVIEWNDFPLLDRAKTIETIRNNPDTRIKLADGSEVPFSDITSIPEYVNDLKLKFLQESMEKAETKGYDLRHIQAHVNVTREWFETAVANNFASVPAQLQEARSLDTFFKPTTLKMEWDTGVQQVAQDSGFIGPNHWSTMTLGHHYELQTNLRTQDNAFGSVFGEDAKLFQDAQDGLSQGVTSQGAGAGTFTFSNADYGDKARLFVQDVGKATALVMQKWRDRDILALSPHINAIRDNQRAAAELGVITNALRRDAGKYYIVRDDALGGVKRLVDRDAVSLLAKQPNDYATLDDAIEALVDAGKKGEYKIENPAVLDFLEAHRDINQGRLNKMTTLINASGLSPKLDDQVIYAPPVDTKRYPHFAFVSAKNKIGANTDVTMITAKSDDQLRALAGQVGDEYEVIYKDQIKRFHEAKGQYDYSLSINESRVNSDMERRGVLGDFFPEVRAQNVLEDYVQFHGNSSDTLVRTGVQVKNRQFTAELGFLSDQYTQTATSTFTGSGKAQLSKIADPFGDYKKTMLNISPQSEYPLLDSLNEFTDKLSKTFYTKMDKLRQGVFDSDGAKAFGRDLGEDAAGVPYTPVSYANHLMEEAGLNSPYKSIEALIEANEKYPKNIVKEAVQKVNYWLATTTLRLDFANAIVNTISTPIMLGTEWQSIKYLVGNDSELAGKLRELTHVKVPGQDMAVPSFFKTLYESSKDYFGPNKAALIQRFTENGDIKGISTLYHEVLDDLAYKPGQAVSKWQEQLGKAVEKGSKITGNDFAEEFTRFVSANMMLKLTQPLVDAGKMGIKEQNSYISSFVNRVQGNYIYSQRPVAFQGTVGSAISLFQTYSFNVLQQLTRHMENGDKKTLAVFAGLQSAIYGMNGLPAFDAINTHLIGTASGNPTHQDIYSSLQGKELGDWLLYGTASAFPLFGNKAPALYSRGDINPRNATLLPVNPLDVPAVSASIRLVGSIAKFGQQAAGGADLSASFLQALEHQGWSRPLAGFAQLLAGQSTTNKGSLVSAANDLETTSWLSRIPSRLINYEGVQRVMGARPMDEAVALSAMYRSKTYDAIDRQRIEALGEVVKTKLANHQMPDDEELHDFMQKYINSGGRQETFSSSMQRWMKDSNQSVVNTMAQKMGERGNRMRQSLMGGDFIQDYNTLSETPPPDQPNE